MLFTMWYTFCMLKSFLNILRPTSVDKPGDLAKQEPVFDPERMGNPYILTEKIGEVGSLEKLAVLATRYADEESRLGEIAEPVFIKLVDQLMDIERTIYSKEKDSNGRPKINIDRLRAILDALPETPRRGVISEKFGVAKKVKELLGIILISTPVEKADVSNGSFNPLDGAGSGSKNEGTIDIILP